MPPDAPFRLETLGGLTIEGPNGASLPLSGQRKRLAVLAFIAASGASGVSRERVISFFWPDSDEEKGRNALNQVLHGLRRELGAGALPGNSRLRLDESVVSSDVGEFRDAIAAGQPARAVAAYGGPFLEGVYLRDAPEFERWVEDERRALAAEYGNALERLAREAADRGDRTAAIAWWRRRAESDFLSTRIAREYVLALVAAGDREAALAFWRTYAAAVRAELDVDPDPDLARLVEQVRASSPGADPMAAPPTPPASSPAGTLALTPSRSELPAGLPGAPRERSRRPWIIAAAAVAIAIAGAYAATRRYDPQLVVVAPFINETGDSAYDAAGRLMADWVAQGLMRTQLVEVVDARTVAREAFDTTGGRRLPRLPATIARETGAGTLVRGTLYRKGDSLLVQVQVLDAARDRLLHQLAPVTVALVEPGAALEPLRQGVLGAFATLTDSRFHGWTVGSAPPRYDAYLEFMRGLDGLGIASIPDLRRSIVHFRRALQLDSSFALAAMMLAEGADGLGDGRLADSAAKVAVRQRDRLSPWDRAMLDRFTAYREGDWPRVYAATSEMLRIAPDLQDSRFQHAWASIATNRYDEALRNLHAIDVERGWLKDVQFFWKWELLAHHLDGDFAGAIAEHTRSRRRYPGDVGVCVAGIEQHAAAGHEREVDSLLTECGALPGADRPEAMLMHAGNEYAHHGHDAAARRAHGRALALILERTGGKQLTPNDHRLLARAYAGLGRHAEAYAAAKLGFVQPVIPAKGNLGIAAARAGDTAAAHAIIRELAAMDSTGRERLDDRWTAQVYAALGQPDSAVTYIHRLLRHGVPAPFVLHAAPGLLPLRGYPPYEALLAPRRD